MNDSKTVKRENVLVRLMSLILKHFSPKPGTRPSGIGNWWNPLQLEDCDEGLIICYPSLQK